VEVPHVLLIVNTLVKVLICFITVLYHGLSTCKWCNLFFFRVSQWQSKGDFTNIYITKMHTTTVQEKVK
jgi:hypothetical protein